MSLGDRFGGGQGIRILTEGTREKELIIIGQKFPLRVYSTENVISLYIYLFYSRLYSFHNETTISNSHVSDCINGSFFVFALFELCVEFNQFSCMGALS